MISPRNYMFQIQNSKFAKNVVMLAGGAAVGQLISAAISPLLTRQYGPAAFGVSGAFLAIAAVMTNVAGMTYPVAIVLPRSRRIARSIALLALVVAALLSAILAGVMWFAGPEIATLLGMEGMPGLTILLPATVLLTTMLSVGRQWLIRNGLFKTTAIAAVGQSLVANGMKAGIGAFAPSALALVTISALAPAIQLLLMFRGFGDLIRTKNRSLGISLRIEQLRRIGWRYRDFPLYRAPQQLLNSVGFALPMLLLAGIFGAKAAGFYAVTQTVMGLPSALVGRAIGDVFYPKVTESIRNGRAAHLEIGKATLILLMTGLLPFGLIMVAGPEIFSFVFGVEWTQAGHYARWLAPFFLLNLANKPSVAAIAPLGLQGQLLAYEVIATGARCLGLLAGFYWLRDDVASVALFSGAGAIAYALLIAYVVSKAREGR